MFYRRIEKLFDFSEGNDFVELRNDLRPFHAEDCAVQKYVFAPGQFRVKAGSNFQQARHSRA